MRAGAVLARVRDSRPVAAVGGQMSQALGSFALQALAARTLGASGLGTFALLYGALVMAAAVSTGLIGDSLTILDRGRPDIRAGLQSCAVGAASVSGVTAAVVCVASHFLTPVGGALFGGALSLFLLEDVLRRLLMASMRFWSLIVVDLTGLACSVATLAACARWGSLSIASFLLALLVGQAGAALIALPLLPVDERRLVPWHPAALGTVLRFGFWRGTQQAIRPSMLFGARVLITLAVGRLAFGELEASRVYMAPAMLVVQGVGSYLMSSYAHLRSAPVNQLVRRADRAAVSMAAASLVLGALAVLALPILGPIVTGNRIHLDDTAVLGWAGYAAGSAVTMPFASLAAVRGRQSLIVAVRAGDSLLSLVLLWVLLFGLTWSVAWSPFAIALGAVTGGLFTRIAVLGPMADRAGPSGATAAPDEEPQPRSSAGERLVKEN